MNFSVENPIFMHKIDVSEIEKKIFSQQKNLFRLVLETSFRLDKEYANLWVKVTVQAFIKLISG